MLITQWPDSVRDEIVERIASGETLASICRTPGFPKLRTVYDWIEADAQFSARFTRARDIGFDVIADHIMDIADQPPPVGPDGKVDSGAVKARQLQMEAREKLLAKWCPKRYGNRAQVEHSGSIGLESLVTGGTEPK